MTTSGNTAFDPVGLADIAEIHGVKPATVSSWRHRGKLPPPDQVPSGTPIWRRAKIENPDAKVKPLPRLVGPQEVALMFGVDVETVWMWRTRNATWTGPRLPEPKTTIGKTPLWLPGQWPPFAEATNRPIDLSVLDAA